MVSRMKKQTSTRARQRGVAAIEMIAYLVLLIVITLCALDINRYIHYQDRLHLTVATIGPLAADIPPDNANNVRYEQLLCSSSQAKLKHDECPTSEVTNALLSAAIETMGIDDAQRFAMRFEFISDPGIPGSKEYARTENLGQGNCDLYPNVPGGIRLANYLTNPVSTRDVALKNRAHNQFIYLAACYQPTGMMSVVAKLLDTPLFADSLSLRRYWYSGDYDEN